MNVHEARQDRAVLDKRSSVVHGLERDAAFGDVEVAHLPAR